MIDAVRRTFRVDRSLSDAWSRFGQVELWPEWAPHIIAVNLSPAGDLGPTSTGDLRIRLFGRSTFRMTVWEPQRRWVWVAAMPGSTVTYEHRFEPDGEAATTFDWVVFVDGPVAFLVRPLFAAIYGRYVDRAIPRLKSWMVS
jgi:hypothetical protein